MTQNTHFLTRQFSPIIFKGGPSYIDLLESCYRRAPLDQPGPVVILTEIDRRDIIYYERRRFIPIHTGFVWVNDCFEVPKREESKGSHCGFSSSILTEFGGKCVPQEN